MVYWIWAGQLSVPCINSRLATFYILLFYLLLLVLLFYLLLFTDYLGGGPEVRWFIGFGPGSSVSHASTHARPLFRPSTTYPDLGSGGSNLTFGHKDRNNI